MQEKLIQINKLLRSEILQKIILVAGIIILVTISTQTYFQAIKTHGIGLTTDSVEYIWSAENLQKGLGLGRISGSGVFKPMTHWPPFYSIVIAGAGTFTPDNYMSANILGAVFLAVFILLLTLQISRITNPFIAIISSSIIMFSPITWTVFLYALTEPVYMVFFLLGILVFAKFMVNGRRIHLIIASLSVSLALLSRYIGLILIPTFIIAYWIISEQNKKQKFIEILTFTSISVAPLALWLGYNQLVYRNATNRYFLINPILQGDFQRLLETLTIMVKPISTVFDIGSGKIILALVMVTLLLFIYFSGNKFNKPNTLNDKAVVRFILILNLVHILLYLIMLFLSRIFFDPMIDVFRERMLYPAYISCFVLISYCLYYLLIRVTQRNLIAGTILTILFTFIWVSFFQGYRSDTNQIIKDSVKDGIGIAKLRSRETELARFFESIPSADKVYSDNIEVLYLQTNYPAYQLTDMSLEGFESLVIQNSDIHAYYIIFRTHGFKKNAIESFPHLRLIYSGTDGNIIEQLP